MVAAILVPDGHTAMDHLERRFAELAQRVDQRLDTYGRQLAQVEVKVGVMDRLDTKLNDLANVVGRMAVSQAEERGQLRTSVDRLTRDMTKVDGNIEGVGDSLAAVSAIETRLESVEQVVGGVTRLGWVMLTVVAIFFLASILYLIVEARISPGGLTLHNPNQATSSDPDDLDAPGHVR